MQLLLFLKMRFRAEFVTDIVTKALQAGASDAEAVFSEGDEFETLVRLGQVEQLKEAGSRALGLRVFQGNRTASTTTSDLTAEGIEKLISGAMALVQVTSEDPFAGLPEPEEFGKLADDLDLYYDDVYSLPAAERIEYARRTEAAAMAADARIQNSGGGSFDAATGRKILANSRGFVGEVRRSSCSHCGAADRAFSGWRDAARLLVFQPAIVGIAGFAGVGGIGGGAANGTKTGSSQSSDAARAAGICAGGCQLDSGCDYGGDQWKRGVSQLLIFSGEAG